MSLDCRLEIAEATIGLFEREFFFRLSSCPSGCNSQARNLYVGIQFILLKNT